MAIFRDAGKPNMAYYSAFQRAYYDNPDNQYWNETYQATERKDIFVFRERHGEDTIRDFALNDKIRFVDFAGTFRDLTFAVDADAGVGDCGVRADEALAPGMAGENGVGLEGGETGAEGMGVVSGVGQHRAGLHPRPFRAGPVARRSLSGREEHTERASPLALLPDSLCPTGHPVCRQKG